MSFLNKSTRMAHRGKSVLATGMAAVTLTGLVLIPAGPAFAGGKGLKAVFAHCPITAPKVKVCITATTTGGEFQVASTTLALSAAITINLGLYYNKKTGLDQGVAPTDGTPALNAPAIPVSVEGISGILTATPQLLALPQVNIPNFLTGAGPALPLPLDVLLSGGTVGDLGLGTDCTIGDAANPISVDMTTGTTDPPGPNTPISGSIGNGNISQTTGEYTGTGVTVVDNSFAVPGAYNCGPLGILDPVLNAYEGFPSASGNNTAIMNLNDNFVSSCEFTKTCG